MNKDEIILRGIDEIPMFTFNTKTKEFSVLGHKFEGVNSIEDFINYIHNLGKENKELKEKVNQLELDVDSYKNKYERANELYLDTSKKVNQLETNIDEAIELIKKFDVFKEFSFPLMKRDEENQVKSSIDYEFKTTLYKQLSSILERGKE